jgi:hypothetical protein
MFNVGDLVKVYDAIMQYEYVGFIECIVDNKVGVRWLNDNSENRLSVYTNPLDFLRKVDKIDERGKK